MKDKKIKNRLAILRKKEKLTIQQVADALNLSNGTISRYEQGTREPKLETWIKLADFFNVSVPYLQGIEDYNTNYAYDEMLYKYGGQLDSAFYRFKNKLDKATNFEDVSNAFFRYVKKLEELKKNIKIEMESPEFGKNNRRMDVLMAQNIRYTEPAKKLYKESSEFREFCKRSGYVAIMKNYAEYLNSKNKGIEELNKMIDENPILNAKEQDL